MLSIWDSIHLWENNFHSLLLLKDLMTEHCTSPKPVFNVTDYSRKSNFFWGTKLIFSKNNIRGIVEISYVRRLK